MSSPSYVTWRSVAPIISNVVVSPWNILIGGLLIQSLRFTDAVLSILVGYTVLGVVFYVYGSLGFHKRKKTSELLEPVFGKNVTTYVISTLLALGQIGWFAIITAIGGSSLGALIGVGPVLGILIYAVVMYFIAILNLHDLGVVKFVITIASAGLIAYLLSSQIFERDLGALWMSGDSSRSVWWGIFIVVSSLISFSSVTPDFFSQVERKRDVLLSTIIGLIIPGIGMTVLGAVAFSPLDTVRFDLLIGSIAFSSLGHILNIITNTDASIAVLTPGNRLRYMFQIDFRLAVAIATGIGTTLALLGIVENLETWLRWLAGVYPSIILLTVGYYAFAHKKLSIPHARPMQIGFMCAVMVMVFFFLFFSRILI